MPAGRAISRHTAGASVWPSSENLQGRIRPAIFAISLLEVVWGGSTGWEGEILCPKAGPLPSFPLI